MTTVLDAVEPKWARKALNSILPKETLACYSCRVPKPEGAIGANRTIALTPTRLMVVEMVYANGRTGFPGEKAEVRSIPLRRIASVSASLTMEEGASQESRVLLEMGLLLTLADPEETLQIPFSDQDFKGDHSHRLELTRQFAMALDKLL